jgi:hypothetical protein
MALASVLAGTGADAASTAKDPVSGYRPVAPTGFQILGKLSRGRVFQGPQSEPGLVSEKGDVADVDKSGNSVAMRWYFLPWLGAEAETGFLLGLGNAPGASSMFISREWSSNLGLSAVVWQQLVYIGRVQAVASGGLAYSRLALMDQYKNFVERNTDLEATDKAASGMGWYGGSQARWITNFGLLVELGARLDGGNPSFPGSSKAFSGTRIAGEFGVGYMF